MILAGLVGVAILSCAGIFKWKEVDDVIISRHANDGISWFHYDCSTRFCICYFCDQSSASIHLEASPQWIGSKDFAAFWIY